MLLAIDGSTVSTGFAFGGVRSDAPRGGVWKLPGAGPLEFDRTLGTIAEMIISMAQFVKAEHVCIEAPIPIDKVDREHSAATSMALIQLTGAMRSAAWRTKAKVHLYSVFEVRRYFTGYPYRTREEAKPDVMRQCQKYGWSYENDDQADALAVWAYGMSRNYQFWSPPMGILAARAPA